MSKPAKPPKPPNRRMHLQCKAKSKSTGERCGNAAKVGLTVCRMHGGSAPQAKKAALARIHDMLDPDRILRTTAARAAADPADFYNDDGSPKPLTDIPKESRCCISMIKTLVYNEVSGDGKQSKVVEYRLHDATKNAEMLFKHLGLFEPKRLDVRMVAYKWEDEK